MERGGRRSKGRPKQRPKEVGEDLLAEFERLRAEKESLNTCKPWFWRERRQRKNSASPKTMAEIFLRPSA